MAQTDRFYVGMIQDGSGLDTSLKPYAIPDNAFSQLLNAYIFRGRVRKRFGTVLMNQSVSSDVAQLYSRLRINLGNTSNVGAASGTVPGSIFKVGQMFSIGTQIYTVQALGTPVTMLNTGAGTGTYNTSTGAYAFTGAPHSTAIYFYPASPVMGLISYENNGLGNEPVYGFDTQFAYNFTGGAWTRLSAEATMGAATWTGNDLNFFWGCTWRGPEASSAYLFVTNYNYSNTGFTGSDTMRFWDGTEWNVFNPAFNSQTATDTILTARIIVTFHERLVLLNVVENTGMAPGTNNVYVNRARWSWKDDPTNASAFYDDIEGYGSFADAATKEQIITAQFIKDRLIVYFESSTWELVYTGNDVQPFIWQQLNTELGAEATFSQVPFDKVVLGVGNFGIHACNGSNVERIDNKIPDQVFQINDADNGVFRVYGIRDYYTELVYWTFPTNNYDPNFPDIYPNRILVYNYKTGSWAFFMDTFTCFGYYEQQSINASEWQDLPISWQESNFAWNTPTLASQFPQVMAGNQQGWTFLLRQDVSYNQQSLQITKIVDSGPTSGGELVTITAINHNLVPGFDGQGDYVLFQFTNIVELDGIIFNVNTVIDENTFTVIATGFTGAYRGAGVLSRVSNISITTKQYNFYAEQGRNAAINKVDFFVDRTPFGQITVDYGVSSSDISMLQSSILTNSILGTGILETSAYITNVKIGQTDSTGNAAGSAVTIVPLPIELDTQITVGDQIFFVSVVNGALATTGPGSGTLNTVTGAYTFTGCYPDSAINVVTYPYPLELTQARVWHPIYMPANGECIQLALFLSDAQLRNPLYAYSDFQLHAMCFYAQPTSSRLQ